MIIEAIVGASLLGTTVSLTLDSVVTIIITFAAVITALGVIVKWVRKTTKLMKDSLDANNWLQQQLTPNGGSSLADKLNRIPDMDDRISGIDVRLSNIEVNLDLVKSKQIINVEKLDAAKEAVQSNENEEK